MVPVRQVFPSKALQIIAAIRGCDFDEWVSDHQALVSEDANGRGTFNLEIMDINQKTIDLIWPHTFHSFALIRLPSRPYVSTAGEPQQDGTYFQQGTYQVDAPRIKLFPSRQICFPYVFGMGVRGNHCRYSFQDSTDICFLPSGSCSGFPRFWPKTIQRFISLRQPKYPGVVFGYRSMAYFP